jgi:hypothetical protein
MVGLVGARSTSGLHYASDTPYSRGQTLATQPELLWDGLHLRRRAASPAIFSTAKSPCPQQSPRHARNAPPTPHSQPSPAIGQVGWRRFRRSLAQKHRPGKPRQRSRLAQSLNGAIKPPSTASGLANRIPTARPSRTAVCAYALCVGIHRPVQRGATNHAIPAESSDVDRIVVEIRRRPPVTDVAAKLHTPPRLGESDSAPDDPRLPWCTGHEVVGGPADAPSSRRSIAMAVFPRPPARAP